LICGYGSTYSNIFLAPSYFYSQTEFKPTHMPSTQTVRILFFNVFEITPDLELNP
jgi:hypothetical protein